MSEPRVSRVKSNHRDEGVGMLRTWLVVLFLGLLTACSASGQPTESAAGLSEDYQGALPVQEQLIVGTLRLEEGEWTVTADQAAELIPLWKAVRSLSSSDTAADSEVQAVLQQIQETMGAEQLEAIAAMRLTQEDLFSTVQELGIQPGGAAAGDQASGAAAGGPPAGFVIEGGTPGGFQGGGHGGGGQVLTQDLDPDQLATLEARRASGGGPRAGGWQFLIDPLLEMLEAKVGA